jgi:hypothetical protein
LRATNALAAHWHAHGRNAEARGRLAPILAGFSDAVATADLARAKALFSETG